MNTRPKPGDVVGSALCRPCLTKPQPPSDLDKDYYIINLSHQRRDQPYIGAWRPECKGYAWPLAWAGKYGEQEVRSHLDYYNSGENIAVACSVVDALSIAEPKPGWIDGDVGPVIPNTAATWQTLLANVIALPKFTPKPQYRGAPRQRKKA